MKRMNWTWSLCLGLLLSFTIVGCESDTRIDELENELIKLKKELKEQKKKAEKEKQEADANLPFIKLGEEGKDLELNFYPGEELVIKVESKDLNNILGVSNNSAWKSDYNEETKELAIIAPIVTTSGNAKILVTGSNDKNQAYSTAIKCTLMDYSSPYGTFILNEGSVWSTPSEMGSLIYITPRKSAIPNVYFAINGRAPGACTQDMFESGGKYFVIAQNDDASTDGKLTIFDTKTLKKIGNYSAQLKDLDWPTHIAVVDGHKIYIRDNKGIWFFNTAYSANTLTLIENTRGAAKKTMAVSHGKIFFSQSRNLKVIDSESNKVVHEAEFNGVISGIVGLDDNHIYVSYYVGKTKVGVISKINTETYEVEQQNEIPKAEGGDLLSNTFGATPEFSAKGDTIYFSSLSQKVYRHIYSQKTTKLMVDIKEELNPEHDITYNTAQVHPVTGQVYMNTLLGYGPKYKTNTIYRFDMSGDKAVLLDRWDNLTRFPAGIFFPPREVPAN